MPSLYVHIPFCEKKCIYCDFYSIEHASSMEDFLHALSHEIGLYAEYAREERFDTVFFGGGTPSLLNPGQLASVLSKLHSIFPIATDAEVTLEANPGTVTHEKLAAYREAGVNRLSIGIQSFHESELRFLSRIHNVEQGTRCVELAYEAGFDDVSIDLIYSIPGQTLGRWEENLREAVRLNPTHVSAYGLIVEDGTPLARMVNAGVVSPMPSDEEAAFYEFTMAFMEANGFEHYEVSNYARPGFRSRHNYNYWSHGNYLGFGPSAHSFWKDSNGQGVPRRWWNISNFSTYCERLRNHCLPLAGEEYLTTADLVTERILLGLRSDGLDLRKLRDDFDIELPHARSAMIDELISENMVTRSDSVLRLTRKGYLLCDEVCGRLMV